MRLKLCPSSEYRRRNLFPDLFIVLRLGPSQHRSQEQAQRLPLLRLRQRVA